jgi:uncharacterized repeat protein (TIGR04076 family)
MKRREFLEKSGCCAAVLMASRPEQQQSQSPSPPSPSRRRYKFEIEVAEGEKSRCHKVGEKFNYPQDLGKICPWLRDSMSGVLRALEWGAILPWEYEGTPYQKVIDPNGVTTEFIRCPDPTAAGIVVKITRTAIQV